MRVQMEIGAPHPLVPHGEPGGARTHDPLIKSQMLYQLSYGLATGQNRGTGPAREALG
jgi:hypothetical protein